MRPPADHPGIRAIGGEDLGGTTSLNLRVGDEVVRVHAAGTSRRRVEALRTLRLALHDAGLVVGVPTGEVSKVGEWWLERETFVVAARPPATWASYVEMFRAMGVLHRVLADVDVALPPPRVATYGPPSSLRRWLRTTERFVDVAEVRRLARRLDAMWVTDLPRHVLHGDVRLPNIGVTPDGVTAFFDFGFAAVRRRVHDLAFSLAWVLLRPDDRGTAEAFDWALVPELLDAYGDITDAEVAAIDPYLAAVPLYLAAVAGFTPDPVRTFDGERPFVRIAEWVLDNRPCANLSR